eukprot:CAMPEP_0172894566 /NCGR_PEP_ID=MMETSP1075-20121228/151219_1 /TAXON_ID=2916 /ORGANISM="Ceratium fusus, Strain PA161109" /LENGTH=109 /DNA_ID=CAMNT_0013749617 /DNA_START=143 /DNA_END=472 /DNA_ORIENTATION=+
MIATAISSYEMWRMATFYADNDVKVKPHRGFILLIIGTLGSAVLMCTLTLKHPAGNDEASTVVAAAAVGAPVLAVGSVTTPEVVIMDSEQGTPTASHYSEQGHQEDYSI